MQAEEATVRAEAAASAQQQAPQDAGGSDSGPGGQNMTPEQAGQALGEFLRGLEKATREMREEQERAQAEQAAGGDKSQEGSR